MRRSKRSPDGAQRNPGFSHAGSSPGLRCEAEQEFVRLSDAQKTILSVGLDWAWRKIFCTFSMVDAEGISTAPTGEVILAQPLRSIRATLASRGETGHVQLPNVLTGC